MSCCFLLLVLPLYCFFYLYMYFYRLAANKSCSMAEKGKGWGGSGGCPPFDLGVSRPRSHSPSSCPSVLPSVFWRRRLNLSAAASTTDHATTNSRRRPLSASERRRWFIRRPAVRWPPPTGRPRGVRRALAARRLSISDGPETMMILRRRRAAQKSAKISEW